MTRERKKKILEVSIESDALFQPDTFINATYESTPSSLIIHNVYDPSVAVNALRRARHVRHVVDMGEHNVADLMTLHIVKVIYDGEAVRDNVDAFRRAVRWLISGACRQSHL